MKKIGLKLVAAFEVIYGCFSLILVVGAALGMLPPGILPLLWYGTFPLLSLFAGVSLWLQRRYSVALSILVLLLQVPAVYPGGLLLNLGAPLNLTFSGTWLSHEGGAPTVLGINFLALGILILLLWCRPALHEVFPPTDASNKGPGLSL